MFIVVLVECSNSVDDLIQFSIPLRHRTIIDTYSWVGFGQKTLIHSGSGWVQHLEGGVGSGCEKSTHVRQ